MAGRKSLVKPRSHTLKNAEKDLKNPKASRATKGPAGYTLRNSKGVRAKKRK